MNNKTANSGTGTSSYKVHRPVYQSGIKNANRHRPY